MCHSDCSVRNRSTPPIAPKGYVRSHRGVRMVCKGHAVKRIGNHVCQRCGELSEDAFTLMLRCLTRVRVPGRPERSRSRSCLTRPRHVRRPEQTSGIMFDNSNIAFYADCKSLIRRPPDSMRVEIERISPSDRPSTSLCKIRPRTSMFEGHLSPLGVGSD